MVQFSAVENVNRGIDSFRISAMDAPVIAPPVAKTNVLLPILLNASESSISDRITTRP